MQIRARGGGIANVLRVRNTRKLGNIRKLRCVETACTGVLIARRQRYFHCTLRSSFYGKFTVLHKRARILKFQLMPTVVRRVGDFEKRGVAMENFVRASCAKTRNK